MKRRMLSMLAVLLGCVLTVASAEECAITSVQSAEGGTENLRSMALDDTVYLLSAMKELYAFDPATQRTTLVPMRNANPECERITDEALHFHGISAGEAVPEWLQRDASLADQLFSNGKTLYGVNEMNGTLYRVEIAKGEATLHAVVQLDFFSDVDGLCLPSLTSGVVCDGSLYLKMCLTQDEQQSSYYRYDMATGARTPLKGRDTIAELVRYKDNRLLLLEEASDLQWRITELDPATDERVTLFESDESALGASDVFGLLYDAWRDRVLLQADKELLALGGENAFEVVAYLPPVLAESRAVDEDGLLLLMTDTSVYSLSTVRTEKLDKPLQIAVCYPLEDWIDSGFAQAYPSIPVKQREGYASEAVAQLAEQVNIQSDEIDVFEVPVGSAALNVLQKGYYAPLNQSTAIREKTEGYRPFFRQTVMHGDDIAAVPNSTELFALAYSEYALAQLGLTAEELPATFDELLDFLLAWDERVGDAAEQAGITPFGAGMPNILVKAEIYYELTDRYFKLMEQDASAIPRYEAELAGLLDKLTQACAAMPETPEAELYVETDQPFQHIQIVEEPSYLFTPYGSFLPGRRVFSNAESVSDFVPLALSLPEQEAPMLLMDGTMFIVNPYSSHKREALQWLDFYVTHRPAADAAALEQNAVPVESALYTSMTTYFLEDLARLETCAQAAEGAAKGELESRMEAARGRLQSAERIKWEVSAQALEDYERMWEQSTVWWQDSFACADSFGYLRYLNEGLDGKTVAHAFFAANEMVLKESR